MEIPAQIPAGLRLRCVTLESLGVDETGWKKADALLMLKILEETDVAILGGDIYQLDDGKLTPTYDNWYCERGGVENLADYARRSQGKARDYLEGYPSTARGSPVIVFVFSSEPTAGFECTGL